MKILIGIDALIACLAVAALIVMIISAVCGSNKKG